MKTFQKITVTALSLAFILTICGNKNKPAERKIAEPQGVVATYPFEYDENRLKYIFMDAMVNDSIALRVFFDTGWPSITFPTQFTGMVESEAPITVQIGEWSKTYAAGWENRDVFPAGHPFVKAMGDSMGIIGWNFFDDKIIEISFSDKQIREYADTDNLPAGYESLQMAKETNMLGIPISVLMQGKKIEENLLFDTGANGSIMFNSDIAPNYDLNLNTAEEKSATRVDGQAKGGVLAVDSIYLGNALVTKQNVVFAREGMRKAPFSGLLGTRVLEKFDFILDLKNNVFYYKLRTDM